ncbi:MAG TPA: YoaK family protein [Solirubrobacteraceae bacterium]|jgi:uncharacterized membrane protein YoaK (UPF0700 family)|nr:YoaK family protein [Solirubrobacteraceae bacterium]
MSTTTPTIPQVTNRGSETQASPRPPKVTSLRHPLALTLLSLTFTTGVVDSVSYLGLGHVFTANMTGNVVLLGFGLAGAGHLPVLAPVISLAAFLLGATLAGRVAAHINNSDGPRLTLALALEITLVAAAAVFATAVRIAPGTIAAYIVIALLALAMGVRNATVRKIALPDLTTTVLTMTLTGLAAESPLGGGTGAGTTRRLAASGSLLAGALAGALLTRVNIAAALGVAAAAVATSAVAYASRKAGS